MRMINLSLKYEKIINALKDLNPPDFSLAVVLGSGLGEFAEKVNILNRIKTSDLPDYPSSTVEGHKGFIYFAEYLGKNILLFQGRIHHYEGYNFSECLLPIQIIKELNCKNLILTNAAGGISSFLEPGDLMLNIAFNTTFIASKITKVTGIHSLELVNKLRSSPNKDLNDIIRKAATEEKIRLKEGNYWYVTGPSYETPAEIRMIDQLGFHVVGMSTAHEAAYANFLGLNTSAVSCITNFAAGKSSSKLNHNEVMETANKVKQNFENLIKRIIKFM